MTAAHEWLALELARWWPRVADHLWQATLFTLVVLAASFALNRGPARVRHFFWVLASTKFIFPAALLVVLADQVGVPSLFFFKTASTAQHAWLQGFTEPVWLIVNNYELTVHAGGITRHHEIYCVVTITWLVGCLTLLVAWAKRRRDFFQMLKCGRPTKFGREWQALKNAQESLGLKRDVALVISSRKMEPTVCGVWNPVIMLPESIAEHLDDSELQAIMFHELVHIQRRDNLIGNCQMVICALFWFHPLVWFISRKLYDERERACDERVLEICATPEAYAASILKVVRFTFGWKVAGVTGAASSTNLRRRIENIMSRSNSNRNGLGRRLLAGTLLALALVLMVVAGMYKRVDSASKVAARIVDGNELVESRSNPDLTGAIQKNSKPPQPPEPPQEPQPPQVPQPAQPAETSQPAQPNPPTEASQPVQPTQPSQPAQASQPDQPPPPPPSPSTKAPSQPPPPPPRVADEQDKPSPKADKKKSGQRHEIVKGELIEAPQPIYHDEAKEQKVEGTVTVGIVIDEEGKVVSAKVVSGHQLLHGASRDAAFKARFKPTIVDGKPAKVSGAMTYNFVLDKK